jgi:hypothetical protein
LIGAPGEFPLDLVGWLAIIFISFLPTIVQTAQSTRPSLSGHDYISFCIGSVYCAAFLYALYRRVKLKHL